eukprot:gene8523-347_t
MSLHKINKDRKKTTLDHQDKSKLGPTQNSIKRKDSIIGIIFGGKKTKSLQNVTAIQSNEERNGSFGNIFSSRGVKKQSSDSTMTSRRESVKNFVTIPEKEFTDKFKIEFVCHPGSTLIRLFHQFIFEVTPEFETYSTFYILLHKTFDQKSKNENRHQETKNLLTNFLQEDSKIDLSKIDQKEKKRVFDDFEKCSLENPPTIQLFSNITKKILELLEENSLDKFLQSEIFRHYAEEYCGATYFEGTYSVEKEEYEAEQRTAKSTSRGKVDFINPADYYLTDFKECEKLKLDTKDIEFFEEEIVETSTKLKEIKKKREVKCATLDKLVEQATNNTHIDHNNEFQYAFLLTYRSFTTPQELMDKLIVRFFTPPPDEVSIENFGDWQKVHLQKTRLLVAKLIKSWMENHFYDFDDDKELVAKLAKFINMMKQTKGDYFAKSLQQTLIKMKSEDPNKSKFEIDSTKCPKSIIPKQIPKEIFEWSEKEIARQISLMEFDLYIKIEPKECLNNSWTPENRPIKAPNLNAVMEWFNKLSRYASFIILNQKEDKKRALMISKIIRTANECKLLNNYNACLELISATTITPIFRLKKTWKLVPKKDLNLQEELLQYVSSKGNFKVLRDALLKISPPCIPYIGLLLRDLTYADDTHPNQLNEKINFKKRKQIASLIRDWKNNLNSPYALLKISDLSDLLLEIPEIDESIFAKLSMEVEPKKE